LNWIGDGAATAISGDAGAQTERLVAFWWLRLAMRSSLV
jgi:hypothetical protein